MKGTKFINIHDQDFPASLVLRIQIERLGMINPNAKRIRTTANNTPRESFRAAPIPVIMESNI